MKIILIGIPGAGKSTQGNLLSKQLHIPYISTGHIFRKLSKEKTKLGRYIKETINAGLLIPDDKTIEILNSYLKRPEYKNGYILDGFPRTLNQAKAFKDQIDKVIYLKIDDKESLWRLAYREDDSRQDDTLEAVKKRIEIFHKITEPVLAFYQQKGLLAVVDGSKELKEVNEEILESLGKHLVGNRIKDWRQKGKKIVVFVGLNGSGKSYAADYFAQKGFPVVKFGAIINDLVEKLGKPHTNEVHKQLRIEYRKKYGMAAMALLNKEKIDKAFEKSNIVVIDGLRSWEEYLYLKQNYKSAKIYLICIYADKDKRYSRVAKRGSRNQLTGEERDWSEVLDTNMGPTIALADKLIVNNSEKEDFEEHLEDLYREIYFV
ncbi:MAG: hypothetical protein KatS3mg090_0298 [Patescibacteria group bacterium]|nr:MAG: hypothetical protein KatS3mg090_0298 [Patescibacteria group bacterium]